MMPFFLFLATFCSTTQLILAGWWMDAPYENDAYNHRAKYEANTTITCIDDTHQCPNSTYPIVEQWILPDLTSLEPTQWKGFQALYGYASWLVDLDGVMHITFVQERHFGFYHCVWKCNSSGQTYITKRALNYKGPYFGDLWEIYEKNVIIGLSAGLAALALGLGSIVVYECKHKDDKDDNDDDSEISVNMDHNTNGKITIKVPDMVKEKEVGNDFTKL